MKILLLEDDLILNEIIEEHLLSKITLLQMHLQEVKPRLFVFTKL